MYDPTLLNNYKADEGVTDTLVKNNIIKDKNVFDYKQAYQPSREVYRDFSSRNMGPHPGGDGMPIRPMFNRHGRHIQAHCAPDGTHGNRQY